MLHGSKTRRYLRVGAKSLAEVLPALQSIELRGSNHGATQSKDQWGKPSLIARAIKPFLAGP